MMTSKAKLRRWLSACALCLVVTVLSTGCEPLRKKFVRQKKKDKEGTGDFIPVLEPEEYPVKRSGPMEQYAQQYSLFTVWVSDFADNFETMDNEKRLMNDLDAAIKAIDEMGRLVKAPVSDELGKIKEQLQYIRGEYEKPKAFRNVSRMASEIRNLDMTMRKKFKMNLVKEQLIAE
jgi:hypothetical protein